MKLLELLTYKRPAGSSTELQMIERYIDTVPDMRTDGYGNRYIRIGEDITTMFSCHTDTVHDSEGIQKVMYDKILGEAFVDKESCLGADDGAGIYILLELIKAGVNGLYVFHRDEEIGGRGSSYIANKTPMFLLGIKRCLAFDRRGTQSVITHQGYERCCSAVFAEELCQALMFTDMVWFPDDTGSFTDSANYTDIIPECTNISCGYENEHSGNETLDVPFVEALVKLLIITNFDGLITKRDPSEIDTESYDYIYGNTKYDVIPSINSIHTHEDMVNFVYDYPDEAAELLFELKSKDTCDDNDDEIDDGYYEYNNKGEYCG